MNGTKFRKSLPVGKQTGNLQKLIRDQTNVKLQKSALTVSQELELDELDDFISKSNQIWYEEDDYYFRRSYEDRWLPWKQPYLNYMNTARFSGLLRRIWYFSFQNQLQVFFYDRQTVVPTRDFYQPHRFSAIKRHWDWLQQEDGDVFGMFRNWFPEGRIDRKIKDFVSAEIDRGESLEKFQWLDLVVLFRPLWMRCPSEWQGDKKESLIRHLFVIHDVPSFMIGEWDNLKTALDQGFIWQFWTIMLGQGVDFRECYPNVTKGFQNQLFKISWGNLSQTNRTIEKVALLAEIKRLGGSDLLAKSMLNYHFFGFELWFNKNLAYQEFLRDTVLWFRDSGSELASDQIDQILGWGVHLHTEGLNDLTQQTGLDWYDAIDNINQHWQQHRRSRQIFRWQGRAVLSVLESSRRYQEAWRIAEREARLGSKKRSRFLTWAPLGMKLTLESSAGCWKIEELCSSRDLEEEGRSMSHCVGRYAPACYSGLSRIYSFRLNGKRKLTVEVSASECLIKQSRGKANREATPEEWLIVRQWQKQIQKAKLPS